MKLVLWGGFGGVNLGDDLILYSSIIEIESLNVDLNLKVFIVGFNYNPLDLSERYPNIPLVKDSFLLRIATYMQGYRVFVPGGQVIDEENKFFPLGKLALDSLCSKFLTLHDPILFSVGVRSQIKKPLHTLYLFLLRQVVSSVYARDEIGVDFLKSNLLGKCTRSILDPVLANEFLWNERECDINSLVSPILLIHGVEKSRHSTSMTICKLKEFVDNEDEVITIDVLQHDCRHDVDAKGAQKFFDCHVSEIDWVSNISDLKSIYRQHTFIFTNRLHAAVMGLISGGAVYLDEGHNKLLAIHEMGFVMASFKRNGVVFYYLNNESWYDLKMLKKERICALKEVLSN